MSLRYVAGLVAFAAALAGRFALDDLLPPDGFPFLTFFPAVVLVTLFCGLGPGLLTAALSVAAAKYFFIPALHSFAPGTPADALALGVFALILLVDCVVIHVMTRSLGRVRQERAQVAELSAARGALAAELEQRLDELRRAVAEGERTRAALAAGEARLRLATEGTGTGIWELDLVAGAGRWSSEAVTMFGARRPEFGATEWHAVVHPEDLPAVAAAWHRAIEDGAPYEATFRTAAPAPDGGERWVLTRGRVEHGPDGRPLRGAGVLFDVTARRRAEAARAESEARFRALAEATREGVVIHDGTMIVEANTAFWRMHGYASRDEVVGRPMLALIAPEARETVADRAGRQSTEPYETLGLRPDGTRIPIEVEGRPVLYQGRLMRVAVSRDLTRRKAQEAALRESEARQRELRATINLGIFMARRLDGTITYWSLGSARLYGWTAAEAMGQNAHALLRTVFPVPPAEIEAALEQDGEWTGDLRQRARDGREVVVTARKALRRAADGSPAEVLESLADVTAQRAAEAALAESEARLRSVVETAADGILVADQAGLIVAANPAALRIFGYAGPEELLGRGLGVLMPAAEAVAHGGDLAAHEPGNGSGAPARNVARSGRELTAVRRDGGEFPVELSIASFTSSGEGFVTGVVRDVTERKRAEELRRMLAREVDHRAKNALAVALSLLRLTPRDNAERFAASVEGRVSAMARAHSLLATQKWAGADLRTLAEGELAAHAGRVTLEGPAVHLAAEAVQPVAMLLHELATNAVKYGALTTAAGRVMLRWAFRDGELLLRWSEQDGPAVEGPPVRPGFGSRLIASLAGQQLGGRAECDWAPEGLTCRIAIAPRFAAPAGPVSPGAIRDKPPARPAPGAAAARPGGVPRVLIVEDEMLLALELEATLREAGCTVVGPARSLAEAVRHAAGEPDLAAAVMDINLGNGELSFPAADLLQTRGVPIIFATGYGSAKSLEGRDHSAVAVLIKPYPRPAMLQALDMALRRETGTVVASPGA